MDQHPHSNPHEEKISACAESRGGTRVHPLSLSAPEPGEAEEAAAPSVASSFFEEHAITQEIADARPYIRYEQGDTQLLRQYWPNSPRFAARVARQAKGRIIPRYAPACLGALNVPAELRPDDAVVTASHWHYHGGHPENAELVFPTSGKPLPKRWIHSPEEMTRHIEKKHGGVNVNTVHLDENRAKYVFPPGDGAKRLDMHPDAWAKFVNASRVFFIIEGCIKADAVLSAGEAVFSVPSVTLWRAPELSAFTRYLRGKMFTSFLTSICSTRKLAGIHPSRHKLSSVRHSCVSRASTLA